MLMEQKAERERSAGILEACEQAFKSAYQKQADSGSPAPYIVITGDAESIRLCNYQEPYDIILDRPKLDAPEVAADIAFWIARIPARPPYQRYEYLVALKADPGQLYIRKRETDEPVPYGPEPTNRIISYIEEATLLHQPLPQSNR
jgi:hypothetical protein